MSEKSHCEFHNATRIETTGVALDPVDFISRNSQVQLTESVQNSIHNRLFTYPILYKLSRMGLLLAA